MEQPLQCRQETEPVRKRRRKRRRRCKRHPKDGPHSPDCRGHQNAANSTNGNNLVRILPTLKPILDYLNVNGEIFTREQIMGHLTEYIKQKALFDPADPRKVYCENDQLGGIFGCNEFSTANACELLLRNLQPIDNPPTGRQESHCRLPVQACCSSSRTNTLTSASTTDTCSCSESDQQPSNEPCSSRLMTSSVMASSVTTMSVNRIGMKRNHDNACSDSSHTVYQSQETFSQVELTAGCSHSNWQLPSDHELPLRDTRHNRYCENATDVVTDTSDDLFFLYETDEAPAPVVVDTDEDTFAEEYEPISYSEDEQLLALNRQYADADKIESFDTEVDEGEDGGDELDYGDNSDSEIEEEDKWQCESCSERNHPMTRHCRKCWTVREDWYPTLNRSISDPVSLRNENPYADAASVSDSATTSLNRQQSSYSYGRSKCVICANEPPNGCIIHGRTGHQVTCVGCAKKLKDEGKGCPVCHKRIRLVIQNFI